jgi:hypothetical protein
MIQKKRPNWPKTKKNGLDRGGGGGGERSAVLTGFWPGLLAGGHGPQLRFLPCAWHCGLREAARPGLFLFLFPSGHLARFF